MFVSQAHQCTLILSFFCIFITVNAGDSEIVPDELTDTPLVTTVINVEGPLTVNSGDSAFFNCTTKPSARQIWWSFDNYNITKDLKRYDVKYFPNDEQEIERSVLHIRNIDLNDEGNFTCHIIAFDDQHLSSYAPLNITVLAEVVDKKKTVRLKIDGHDELFCEFKGLPMSNFYWTKDNNNDSIARLKNNTQIKVLNETNVNMTLSVSATNRKDNGTYYCIAKGLQGEISDSVKLLVLDKPKIRIDFVKAVGAEKIYVNWTVDDGNSPVKEYRVQFMENGKEAWQYYPEKIGGGNNSYVLKGFHKDSEYKLRISAINEEGEGHYDESKYIKTLLSDPDFIPKIQVTGVTFNSITIGWNSPSPELEDHVHYYQLFAQAANSKSNKEAIYPAESRNWYLFDNFESATEYNIKVRACSEYTKQCSAYSEIASGTTSDGVSGPPKNVSVECRFDNISQTSFVYVEWEPPINPNGKIVTYQVMLEGTANFKNEEGVFEKYNFGIKVKSVDEKSSRTRFDGVPANTNYTVNVSGITRLRKQGNMAVKNCTMPPTTPEKIKKFSWIKHEENGKYIFKLTIPRISERNGAICCYRVFMVRLGSQKGLDKLRPEDIVMHSYQQVHNSSLGGAYVAEMFTSDDQLSAVFLGDGYVINSTNSACLHCIGLRPKPEQTTDTLDTDTNQQNWPEQKLANIPSLMTTATPPVPNFTTSSPFTDVSTVTDPEVTSHIRVRRHSTRTLIKPLESDADKVDPSIPYDGYLDTNSNYTGFVEIIVYGANPGETLAAYTDYFEMQRPAPPDANMYLDEQESGTDRALNLVAHTLCALVVAALILLAALCLLHRYTKQVARAQGVEMITFRNSFRHLCRSFRGRHQLVSSHPPDMTPISKEDLFDAYVERHRDSDYGFQQEFEQLPDRFADRTTRASDARENIYKNRYPDIKAYDQTRVKLSQIDSIAGSDYINANVVLGYKERKKFICAQGPMDNTVCDYWRMIWEQRLELILMLTNLEEYSKTKCAKYWPDKSEGDKVFGDISVMHVNEKRYSDYIIRELKVSRTMVGRDREERYITQYHFLVWKDFMAPEHPHGILKFIKRMNEAYSLERGPILVHCSAGVGRTGTLVALDSLLQQLNEEGQVSVFNTICDLRHQRNFLVQSLKQYIFVYRALMEVAQYGDTEIPANKLKLTIEELKKVDNKDKCKMEEDYEKIKSVLEDRKPFSVGGGEENRCKNRSELVIPYDRNRVILTPIPGREHSTYINASFIEGYDNSESFIITQDPLEGTIPDFWRMISEQNISVIIMLSDLGDSPKKCPRYWPDDEMCYDHIRVKYIQSESCPYYTRRELSVTNKKSEETVMVTQMQYHGWPTVEGEVPEVTRGLIELADQAQTLQTAAGHSCTTTAPPIVVHCNCGSDRSSMFVGLCILIQQLRTEKRVDIFTTTRKLRSQRNCMLNTFAQYEFLHRAIVNYADLHHLCEDET